MDKKDKKDKLIFESSFQIIEDYISLKDSIYSLIEYKEIKKDELNDEYELIDEEWSYSNDFPYDKIVIWLTFRRIEKNEE